MSVTPSNIAVELGVAAPTPAQEAQWQAWIDRALYLIGKRLTVSALDPADVDYVVLQAVVAHARNPESSTQVDVAIDDGRVSKRYQSGPGGVVILPEWWVLLDPQLADSSGVGSTQMFGEPDTALTPGMWA